MKAGEKTKETILKAGVKLWPNVSLSNVARACKTTHSRVLYHFPNKELRDAIAEFAVKTENSRVIVQLIAEKHKAVKNMSEDERAAHFSKL